MISGFLFAIFAAQNNTAVDLHIGTYFLYEVPVYLVALTSVWLGIIITWLINATGAVSSMWTLRSKETKLKTSEQQLAELTKRIHQLELENLKFRKRLNIEVDEKTI
jgi:uncharacterized integral membrane protein